VAFLCKQEQHRKTRKAKADCHKQVVQPWRNAEALPAQSCHSSLFVQAKGCANVLQVGFLEHLLKHLNERYARHAECSDLRPLFPRPSFKIVVLYIDEVWSVVYLAWECSCGLWIKFSYVSPHQDHDWELCYNQFCSRVPYSVAIKYDEHHRLDF
jgi:hypothetical protein